jgi:hypothetical protein
LQLQPTLLLELVVGLSSRWKVAGSRPISLMILSVYLILLTAVYPGVYSISNRNDYQKQMIYVSEE